MWLSRIVTAMLLALVPTALCAPAPSSMPSGMPSKMPSSPPSTLSPTHGPTKKPTKPPTKAPSKTSSPTFIETIVIVEVIVVKFDDGTEIEIIIIIEKIVRGSGTGDPHLTTFDGIQYDCMGSGDFRYLKSSGGLEAQVRYKSFGPGGQVSFVTGLAARETPSSLVVEVGLDSSNNTYLLVNGTKQSSIAYTDAAIKVVQSGSSIVVGFLASKLGFQLDLFSSATATYFNLGTAIDGAYANSNTICGLLGTPDGDPTNDWTDSSCSAVTIPSTASDLVGKPAYDYCVQTWCLRNQSESLFSYDATHPFDKYYACNKTFPGAFDTSTAPAAIQTLCGTDPACLIDGSLVGADAALATLKFGALFAPTVPGLDIQPKAVTAGVLVPVTLTLNLTSTTLPSGLTGFAVFMVDSVTRLVDVDPTTFMLAPSGSQVFVGLLPVNLAAAGDSIGLMIAPLINGLADPTSALAFTVLNAIKAYSAEAAIGVSKSSYASAPVTGNITGLTMVIEYNLPTKPGALRASTEFAGSKSGGKCPNDSPFVKADRQESLKKEVHTIDLGAAFKAGKFTSATWIYLNTDWHFASKKSCLDDPNIPEFTITVTTLQGGVSIGTAFLAKTPGCTTLDGCAVTRAGTINVTVAADGGTTVAVTGVTDFDERSCPNFNATLAFSPSCKSCCEDTSTAYPSSKPSSMPSKKPFKNPGLFAPSSSPSKTPGHRPGVPSSEPSSRPVSGSKPTSKPNAPSSVPSSMPSSKPIVCTKKCKKAAQCKIKGCTGFTCNKNPKVKSCCIPFNKKGCKTYKDCCKKNAKTQISCIKGKCTTCTKAGKCKNSSDCCSFKDGKGTNICKKGKCTKCTASGKKTKKKASCCSGKTKKGKCTVATSI